MLKCERNIVYCISCILSLKVYSSKFKVIMYNARVKPNPNKTHPFTKSHKLTHVMQVQNIIYGKSSNSKFQMYLFSNEISNSKSSCIFQFINFQNLKYIFMKVICTYLNFEVAK
jgi:hypothetical protein